MAQGTSAGIFGPQTGKNMEKAEKPDFRVIEYPFHLGDLVGGTTNLDDAQFGAYMRLLLANINAQASKGGLPDNEEVLRSYTRMGPKAWKKLWLLIGDKFVRENGKIFHPRVKETVNEIIKNSNTARANRLKGHNSDSTGVEQTKDPGPSNPLTHKPLNPKPIKNNSTLSDNSRAGVDNSTDESSSGFSILEKEGARHSPRRAFKIEFHLDDQTRDQGKKLCKDARPSALDFYAMCAEYDEWINKKGIDPDKPKAAFIGWLKKKCGVQK